MASGGGSSAGSAGAGSADDDFRPYPPPKKNSSAPWVPPVSRTMSLPTEFPEYYNIIVRYAAEFIEKLGDPIEQGGSARIYLIRVNSVYYIVKRVMPSFIGKFDSEVSILTRLQNTAAAKHVVKYLASTKTSKGGFILFPYVPGITLYKWLAEGHSEHDKDRMKEMVNAAVSELHKNGVIHGDVSSKNIYIKEDDTPMLIDFGESDVVDNIDVLEVGAISVAKNFYNLSEAFKPPLVQKVSLPSSKDPIADRIKQLLSTPAAGMGGGYRKKSKSRPKRPAKTRATTKRTKNKKRKQNRSRSNQRQK